jgi:polygalacturonase
MLATMGLVAAGSSVFAAPLGGTPEGKPGARIFDVKGFGAAGDGKALDTAAINRAIDACHAAGGGVVYAPPGTYLSGTVILQSNVTLYLEAGATLLGSKNLDDYSAQAGPPAKGDADQKHLVFARDAENIGLAGPGRIDGQGPAFWAPNGRVQPPPEDDWRDSIAHGWMKLARPSPMLEFYNCKNLRIEEVRIENSPGWTLRPINCDNVFIRGIGIKNPIYGPNCDGIDPTCCHNVFISDCLIDTGDDAICLKSENPYGGELRVSKNITITNCVLSGCCNGIKFGTATEGGFENVVVTNCVIFNEDVPYSSRIECGIAVEMVDGGWIEGVVISNIRMQRVRTPIFIRRGNRRPRPDGSAGTLRGVMIENIHATSAITTSMITGLPGFDVEDVTISNVRIDSEESGKAEWGRDIPELPKAYPNERSFGRLPAHGIYARHVTDLRLRNLDLKSTAAEERPAIMCEDVKTLDIDGLRSRPTAGAEPVLKLLQTKQAFVHNCLAPAGTKIFLKVEGDQAAGIVLTGSNLMSADQAAQSGAEVPKDAVTVAGNVMKG